MSEAGLLFRIPTPERPRLTAHPHGPMNGTVSVRVAWRYDRGNIGPASEPSEPVVGNCSAFSVDGNTPPVGTVAAVIFATDPGFGVAGPWFSLGDYAASPDEPFHVEGLVWSKDDRDATRIMHNEAAGFPRVDWRANIRVEPNANDNPYADVGIFGYSGGGLFWQQSPIEDIVTPTLDPSATEGTATAFFYITKPEGVRLRIPPRRVTVEARGVVLEPEEAWVARWEVERE